MRSYLRGLLHCEIGPAISHKDHHEWYWHGKRIMCTEGAVTSEQIQKFKLKVL